MTADDNDTELPPNPLPAGEQAFESADATLDSRELETQDLQPRDHDHGVGGPWGVDDSVGAAGGGVPDETVAAPTYPQPAAGPRPVGEPGLAGGRAAGPQDLSLEPGDTIGDFEVLEILGRGGFGAVYLAWQASLDRRVALKVTANVGSEGRTMARLDHEHIVSVFSEEADPTGRFRLLCMQLVPGPSLDAVIGDLHKRQNRAPHDTVIELLEEAGQATPDDDRDEGEWTGEDYLRSIDEAAVFSEAFDPSALRDRGALAAAGGVEVAAWVGARLAEAVDFAHTNGVLHRDIKPANVLVDQYGRPLLADFNIAFRAAGGQAGGAAGAGRDASFGGTLAFMAPEHLDAFDPRSDATPDDVDERSDIYSLAIVVYQLLAGRPPFDDPLREASRSRYVAELSQARRRAPVPIEPGPPSARKVLQHTIARGLAPAKADRYASGKQFAAALDGCRELAAAERATPPPRGLARWLVRRPLAWAMLLIFLPQVVGSVVNIAYNRYQVAGLLTAEQQAVFVKLVTGYNAVVYPAAVAALVYFFLPVARMWRDLHGGHRMDGRRVAEARRATLRLPVWVLTAAAIGWLPGGVLFPAMLAWLAPPIDAHVFLHFGVSFAFSGLIAVAYSFCGMQYIAMRVLYPRFWVDATDFRAHARRELAGAAWRMWFMLGAAYVVPFVANVLFALLLVGNSDALPLVSLVLGVAMLGLLGTGVVFMATRAMTKTQVLLTGRG
ncbi:MAG: serine/threonine-protein kinase [Planctomycetota bacterium]